MKDDEIITRKVKSDDFEGLIQLFEEVWHDVDYDKRKKADFVLNQSAGINYCAVFADKVVGSRLSFYQNMYWGTRSVKCVQFSDSCIHPSCRGKGVFLNLDNAFLQEFFSAQNAGELIFNISVLASRRAHEKCGWVYIKSLMKLRKFTQPIKTLFKIGLDLRKLRVPIVWEHNNEVVSIDPKLLRIREEFLTNTNLLHIRYDEETFCWRMKSRSGILSFFVPDLGCVIYKIGVRDCVVEIEIGEVFLYEYTQKAFDRILGELKKKTNADIMWVMVSEGHPLRRYYADSWFLANPKQKYLHHGVRVETNEMREICYNPNNWAISSIDIDTF